MECLIRKRSDDMADEKAHIDFEDMPVKVCNICKQREPKCNGKFCNNRELNEEEEFVCVDEGDFHFCMRCAKY